MVIAHLLYVIYGGIGALVELSKKKSIKRGWYEDQ